MQLIPVLEKYNHHPRDDNIVFEEVAHTYHVSFPNPMGENDEAKTIKVQFTSVTTWIHSHFGKFDADAIIDKMFSGPRWKLGHKYWGLTKEEIKKQWSDNGQAASSATKMHLNLECIMNNPCLNYPYYHIDLLNYHNISRGIEEIFDNHNIENCDKNACDDLSLKGFDFSYFLNYMNDLPNYKPYRTEWVVYHEEYKIAGCIDMLYECEDGSVMVYDWKKASKPIENINIFRKFATTEMISHYPDTNYWHYTFQLNTYKIILEEKYNKKVSRMVLVRLHENASNYELIEVKNIGEDIKALLELRKTQLLSS